MIRVDIERRLGAFALRAAFDAGAGVTALFGRSGAGKSTLINAIAGLVRPERGHIEIDGECLFDQARHIDLPAHRRRIGYVFQEGRLFPHLTVRQNLLYGRRRSQLLEHATTLEQVLDLLGIEALLARRPANLSGGEKQRVAIGRALLASPRLLLMDEPLASLDTARKTEVLHYIERLRDELRLPIFYVSHAVEEVMRVADTVVVLENGKVAAAGATAKVMAHLDPGLAGNSTDEAVVVEAVVAQRDVAYGVITLTFDGGTLVVTDVSAAPGERLRIRIRARDVALALAAPVDSSISNVLRGLVRSVRVNGAHADVEVQVGGTLIVSRITRLSAERLALAVGTPVYVLLKSMALERGDLGYA